ncbi:MAG: peptidase M28, partial [Gammaproteobacteria bacterium]|nr:peptidase M28 [Gammaproteobacteria bacterium]
MRVLNRIVLALLLFIPLSGVLLVCRQVAAETVTAGNEQRLLSDARQVIFEGRRSGEGYFSSDGSRMIFQSEREPGNPFYQIYLMDLETGDIQRVSTGRGKTTCGWIHPRGDRVLFASTHEDPEAENKQQQELGKRAAGKGSRYSWSFDEHYDIYTADNNGRISENITRTMGYDAEGSWSPDGEMIAFASNRRAYEGELPAEEAKIFQHDKSYFMDIYIMGADGSGVRRLTSTPGYDGGPFFSPDGKSIVWRRFNREGDKAEIWTMNLDGTEQKRITHLDVMSWAPFFHPSGDYIIFTNNRHGYGNFELYIVDRNGRSAPVRVTDTPGFDGLPVFSPNGAHLSWTSSRTADHRPQIFQAKWNDTEARKLLGLDSMVAVRVRSDDMDGTAMPDIGRTVPEIRPEDLRLHVEYLASDKLEGRLTGSQGERLATDYVAAVFRSLGLLPAGEDGRYFQEFDFTSGVSMGEENRLMFRNGNAGETFVIDQDWRPLPFSRNGAVEPAPVVFAGYGVVAPASDRFPAYDAYGELEVKDKWVMMFRYLPEDITPEHRQYLVNYAELHYKAMLARDRGALGIILVSGPNAGVEEQLIRLSLDAALSGTSIAGVSITDRLAAGLFGAVGRSLPELQTKLDQGEALPGFPLPGVRIQANIDLI